MEERFDDIKRRFERKTAIPYVSVVIPAYNEELVIEETCTRLIRVMDKLHLPYELLFVNDGSRDGTYRVLERLAEEISCVKVLDFSRNFGHQIAVTAGIDHAVGDVVILIDADLQDPPELIADFLEKWREGYDVVYAVRMRREGETWFKRSTAKFFYRMLRKMTEIEIPVDTGDFRLMDRSVVESLRTIKEKHRFIRGLVSWVGFRQTGVPYERAERFAGESKYPLRKMLKFSLDGITSFSFRPLQWASKLGMASSGIGFLFILVLLYLKIFTTLTIQGWTSLMVVVLFLGGIQLFMLGVLGEYIGRIYDEVRNRPLYLIRERKNFESHK
nr:glycosyltransferase family 2 protein [Ferroacidibacillus organovorans]